MKLTLKAARINKNYTQVEAALLLGISEDTLSNYERGKTFPPAYMVEKIEALYEISYNNINFLPQITI